LALRDASASRKILDSKTYFAAGMAVFFLFFTVQFGVASLIDERANGTLNRLLSMPVRAGEILAGKLLTSVLVGLVSMTVLTTATSLVMGAHWGDPAAVALLVLAGVLAATGVTALVCSLARTAEQAGSWQAVLATLLGLLGGVFFPIAQMGGFAAAASKLSPHSWFLRGLGELAGGGGIAAVLPAVAALLTFAVVTGGIATVRIGRAMRP
jgi:ABC-2 type transport system permease protein